MNELDVLQDAADRLNDAGVPYMLTGSLAMNYYAEPRMTRDIDLVINIEPSDIETFIGVFREGFYVSPEAVTEAVRQRSMFNLIHNESLVKIDFVVRKDTTYRKAEFDRRRQVQLEHADVFVVSKEDLIISKIYWAQESRSEMQQQDVQNLMATGYDGEYLERWLKELDLYRFAKEWLT
jgi:hypothetical protein